MNDRPHPPHEEPPWTLAQALGRAAAELARQAPPPGLQDRVLAAAQAAYAARPLPRPARRRWAAAATCACIVVVGAAALLVPRLPPLEPAAVPGFVAVAPAEAWPPEATAAWLVNTELQGERLAALGLPYDPARAGARIRAQLLLHPSGEVLAVRLVP
jgi:hypothetical protein